MVKSGKQNGFVCGYSSKIGMNILESGFSAFTLAN